MPLAPMTFENWDPYAGQKSMNDVFGGILKNQQLGMQNRYLPQSLQQQLQQTMLANQKSQAELPYAGPQAQANLGYTQAQIPHLNAQTGLINQQAQYYGPEANARMGLQGAQTNKLNQEVKYMPLDYGIRLSEAQRMNNRFGPSFELNKALQGMPLPARAKYIADNQDSYNQMLSDIGNSVRVGGQGMGALSPDFVNQYLPGAIRQGMPQQQSAPSPQQGYAPPQPQPPQGGNNNPMQQGGYQFGSAMNMPNQMNYQQGQMPQANGLPQGPYGFTTGDVASQRKANEMYANKLLTTAATNRQMEGAIQVQSIINDPALNNRAMNASQYAGALGKGSAALAAFSQKNPAAYEDYLNFRHTDMVLLQNRIKTLDQMGGTDKQRKELLGMYDKAMDSMTSNPAQFMTQFSKLKESLANVARGVQDSATPIAPVNRLKDSPNQQSGVVTIQMDDGSTHEIDASKLEAVKKKYGEKIVGVVR